MKTTRYFEEQVLRKRPYIERQWCAEVIAHPIRLKRDVIGTNDVLEKAGRDRFVDYYNTWYRPELMSVVVVGGSYSKCRKASTSHEPMTGLPWDAWDQLRASRRAFLFPLELDSIAPRSR